ncbi:hypothetical protein LS482_14485 [Sinomicrobium kalidii]|uniref:hypothetical protein n=1 Tax=Sinomicrobium kalidii TaxID=2900738 RepID=UPI001E5EFEA9|nr:hypothetical protein [Sinomicrobium kalidii]UGU14895.1 hypothetical protein LS482_14485 [Sinomicrobium kalidii]
MKNNTAGERIAFSKMELEEACTAITSLINKCEKAKVKNNSAQETLLKRRIKALQISVSLIEEKISKATY